MGKENRLIYNKKIRSNKIEEGKPELISVWRMEFTSCFVSLIALFHPTIHTYLAYYCVCSWNYGEIQKWNLIGDINLHINYPDDPNVHTFLDSINVMGLKQHVNFPTHRTGNTLDTVVTDNHCKIKNVNVIQAHYISDHGIIHLRIKIDRDTKKYYLS